ncbi:MAG: response regulator [Anaerolineales bacterium]|nr:response regulator [Anaerolineales bacterium]
MNRLLVLDDNERFADTLKRSIAGFDEYDTELVEVATTPHTAIHLAQHATENKQPFTVFLIDQNLDAEMDGIQTMKELLAVSPDADAIIFTGFDTPQDGIRAYEEGASRYLPKPFEPRELGFILKELSRSRKVRLEEARQRRQFKVAASIAEAVGTSLKLETTMDAVLGTLDELFEKTRLCVLLYDKHQKFLSFAPATLKYYEIKNPKYTQLDTFHLDQGSIACRVAKQTLMSRKMEFVNVGDVSKDIDYKNLNPDTKSEFCVSLLNSNKDLLGVLVLERNRINGFLASELDLIKMVARHISIAIERAQQSEELEYKSIVSTRTSWAANIAHGINSEVNNILSWAYLIRKKAGEDTEIGKYALNIEESAAQLASINPWTNKPSEPILIDTFLQEELLEITKPKDIHVNFLLGASDIKAMIKISQFKNTLRLLVNNASKAMKQMDEKRISVSTRLTNNNSTVEILFKDFGPGISEDKHSSAFRSPFTTKQEGGYGLLFIRQMIEDMNGQIRLLPYEKGRGAEFLIHLQISDSTSKLQGD